MNPNTGQIIELPAGTLPPPEFTVRLDGPREEVEKIAAAVQRDAKRREANRRKNKAARAARRAQR